MGASGREFLYFRMEVEHYKELSPEFRERMDIEKIEHEHIDFSEDESWCVLKSKSVKAYKDLKTHEYKLKQNKQI